VLDTCALIWWTLDPAQLSEKAAAACRQMESRGGVISSISIWEIGIKIKNGKLDIGMTIGEYVTRLKQMRILEIVPVDESIWVESVSLEWANRDPADRTIVATAKLRALPIITKDRVIREFYEDAIW